MSDYNSGIVPVFNYAHSETVNDIKKLFENISKLLLARWEHDPWTGQPVSDRNPERKADRMLRRRINDYFLPNCSTFADKIVMHLDTNLDEAMKMTIGDGTNATYEEAWVKYGTDVSFHTYEFYELLDRDPSALKIPEGEVFRKNVVAYADRVLESLEFQTKAIENYLRKTNPATLHA